MREVTGIHSPGVVQGVAGPVWVVLSWSCQCQGGICWGFCCSGWWVGAVGLLVCVWFSVLVSCELVDQFCDGWDEAGWDYQYNWKWISSLYGVVKGWSVVSSVGVMDWRSHVLSWRNRLLCVVIWIIFWFRYLLCCYLCPQCARLLCVLFDLELFVDGWNWWLI